MEATTSRCVGTLHEQTSRTTHYIPKATLRNPANVAKSIKKKCSIRKPTTWFKRTYSYRHSLETRISVLKFLLRPTETEESDDFPADNINHGFLLKLCQEKCKEFDHALGVEAPLYPWFWPNDCSNDNEAIPIFDLLTVHLREAHNYCVWCEEKYNNWLDMVASCPGPTLENHRL